MKLITLALAAALLLPTPAQAKPKMHRYKVVTSDGGQSIVEGTSMRTKGVFVEILIGKVVDTVVTAPKYVTQLPDVDPEPEKKPAGVVPEVTAPKDRVAGN